MLKEKLYIVSEKIHDVIKQQVGVSVLPTEDFGWENYRYYSPVFRLMHVERYFIDNLLVLHITCFPHVSSGAPIFGFDIIGNEKSDKITGLFLDWSPVLYEHKWNLNKEWKNNRELPNWASMFSSQMIAIRPEDSTMLDNILDFSYNSFCEYINFVSSTYQYNENVIETIAPSVIEKQNFYCEQQAKNPRTLAALIHKIGAERANYFMQHVLFPKIASAPATAF